MNTMDGTTPKISFIPKGSFVRDKSFFEQSRPRSVMGILAGIAFILSVGAYAGLYYYNVLQTSTIAEKTIEIKNAQKEFNNAPEVGEAKVFRMRADLANQLLNAHIIASPILAFLSKNTTESVLYDKFSFRNSADGLTIDISGEAPTYAALAYQVDVLRGKTKEIPSFSVSGVTLTSFGTVVFNFSMTFARDYLLYTKNLSMLKNIPTAQAGEPAGAPAPLATSTATTTSPTIPTAPFVAQPVSATNTAPRSLANNWTVAPRTATTSKIIKTQPQSQSFLMVFWSKMKFW